MTSKAAHRRKMHALQGTRRSLPGVACNLEFFYRTEIAAQFEPRNFVHTLWVCDIAYCCSAIDLLTAQLTAVRRQQLSQACSSIRSAEELRVAMEIGPEEAIFSPQGYNRLDQLEIDDFEAKGNKSLFDSHVFNVLLARTAELKALIQVRELQLQLHQERKERDRLLNQITRSQRDAARHAVEMAEAKHRASLDGYEIMGLAVEPADTDSNWSYPIGTSAPAADDLDVAGSGADSADEK